MTFKEWLLKDVCNATCRERKADEKAEDRTVECIECEQDKMIAWYAGRGIAIKEIEDYISDSNNISNDTGRFGVIINVHRLFDKIDEMRKV